jgi:hypothetical protein
MFKSESGMSSLSLMMVLFTCAVVGLHIESNRHMFHLRSLGQEKADFQSLITASTMVLSTTESCQNVFGGGHLPQFAKVTLNTDHRLSEAQTVAFGFDSHGFHQKIVEVNVMNLVDVFSDGKTIRADLRFIASRDGSDSKVHVGAVPMYFNLDISGAVQSCHATSLTDSKKTLEDEICIYQNSSYRYDLSTKKCRQLTVVASTTTSTNTGSVSP